MLKPPYLIKGDKIGVITPSWCGPAYFPKQFQRGLNSLRLIGLDPILAKHSISELSDRSATPEERAEDINIMFGDKSIKAIIASIGGVYSNEILPFIDYKLVALNPKIVMGYSDITSILLALYHKSKLVTFYGPMIMTQFGEYPNMLPYTNEYLIKTLFGVRKSTKIYYPAHWTDEFRDWKIQNSTPRKREMREGKWEWLITGKAQGRIIGGCLNSILRLKGTNFSPDYANSILFWELPESVGVDYVDLMLNDLSLTGIIRKVKGVIIGRAPHYTRTDMTFFKKVLLKYFTGLNIPVLIDAPFGHCDPIITLPIGIEATLDSYTDNFSFNESGVC